MGELPLRTREQGIHPWLAPFGGQISATCAKESIFSWSIPDLKYEGNYHIYKYHLQSFVLDVTIHGQGVVGR